MRRRSSRNWVSAFIALVAIVAVAAVFVSQVIAYSRIWQNLPPGLTIGGMPAGGKDADSVRSQLLTAFGQPLELRYAEHSVQLDPADIGIVVDVDGALAAAEEVRNQTSWWEGFLDYVLDRPDPTAAVPLPITYSLEQLNTFLAGVAIRFDAPALPPEPQMDSLTFTPGSTGRALDTAASLPLIDAALRSPTGRTVSLVVRERAIPPASAEGLNRMVTARLARFDGVAGVALVNLQTGEELCANCDVAFSGMGLLKVPVAVEAFREFMAPLDPAQEQLVTHTLTLGGNASTNALLATLGSGDPAAGLARVNDGLAVLGLQNTFLALPYDEPAGNVYVPTPANSRRDVDTEPDPARQTTPQDLSLLLRGIYDCHQGGGALLAAWPGDLSPDECGELLDTMSLALPGELLAAGMPGPMKVAQQAGWDGNTLGASAAVLTPGGDYVLVVFLWRPGWLDWQDGAAVVTDVGRATYNYFNIGAQMR